MEASIRFHGENRETAEQIARYIGKELLGANGSIDLYQWSSHPSIKSLRMIRKTFRHSVWLNPKMPWEWPYTHTIGVIREIFPMFELTVDGLERAVSCLMRKN